MKNTLPEFALSIRQPWAHAIVSRRKAFENRCWRKPNPGLQFRGPVAIHASSGMTRDEYDSAATFIRGLGFACPTPDKLARGAIIGTANVVDVVRKNDSPWFFGPVALVLSDQCMLDEPIPCDGALGFFRWQRADRPMLQPKKWMQPDDPQTKRKVQSFCEDMFG